MAWNQQDEERHIKGFADGDDDALTLAYDMLDKGVWNEDKTIRIPFIENARRSYRQLSLIEDVHLK